MELLLSSYNLGVMIVGALFLFTLVVFVHELGHFLVGRWCGAAVEEFAVGMGPEAFGYTDRHNTRWKFCWLPIGGYVKFIDDADPASATEKKDGPPLDPEKTFRGKTVGQRAAIIAAGPAASLLLPIVIFAGMAWAMGERTVTPRVDAVSDDSVAAKAGFEAGDMIVAVNGTQISSWNDLLQRVGVSAGVPMTFTVERNGAQQVLNATPQAVQAQDILGNSNCIGRLGIQRTMSPADVEPTPVGPVRAVGVALEQTWDVIATTGRVVGNLFASTTCPPPFGGPIKIAQTAGQAANIGFLFLLNIAALISISLGIMNLLPIPVLDGGHLLFYAIEAIRGQPLEERYQDGDRQQVHDPKTDGD
ncbi:MAG: RIP metalloprotease, partial [Pseudomonadota bacterium]